MEKALNKLTASSLRDLLNAEIRSFIDCLDYGTMEELHERKARLKEIYELLAEKELIEMSPLIWSRNSAKPDRDASVE